MPSNIDTVAFLSRFTLYVSKKKKNRLSYILVR